MYIKNLKTWPTQIGKQFIHQIGSKTSLVVVYLISIYLGGNVLKLEMTFSFILITLFNHWNLTTVWDLQTDRLHPLYGGIFLCSVLN